MRKHEDIVKHRKGRIIYLLKNKTGETALSGLYFKFITLAKCDCHYQTFRNYVNQLADEGKISQREERRKGLHVYVKKI